ncbi:hypothetical protein C8T65DRAFT_703824 [Cerioporus squamosus]|nr:hypothetical protein C8T65DRAFT_703824 [Cerioporus squamosus]
MCLTQPQPYASSSSSHSPTSASAATRHSPSTANHNSSGPPWSTVVEDFPDGPLVSVATVLLPAGFCREKYGPKLEEYLAGARSWPCSGCTESDEPCEQSNGGAWRCKRCLIKGLNGCEWEIQTYAILGLEDDKSLRKPHILWSLLEDQEAAGLQVDRLEVILPAGLRTETYGAELLGLLADVRAAPCTPCLRIGQECTQTNGESWKCKNCLVYARSDCEWQRDTAAILGDSKLHVKPKIDRQRLRQQVTAGTIVDSRADVLRHNARVSQFVNAHSHLVTPGSPLNRFLPPALRQSSRGSRRSCETPDEAHPALDQITSELAQITASQARQEDILRQVTRHLNIPVPAAETGGLKSGADAEDEK